MTRFRIWDSNGKSPRVPQMWPPASIPWAIMKSHPARSAVTASSMEPTCHFARAPSCAAFATRSESGTNFAPIGLYVNERMWPSRFSSIFDRGIQPP